MNYRIFEGTICIMIDSKVNCPCDACMERSVCNGITFFFLKNKFWVETISEGELFQRLKTLNPLFEFQRDTVLRTVHDCFKFGEMLFDTEVSADICCVNFQHTLEESVIIWRNHTVVPASSVLHYHVVLPLSFALESLYKKQDLLNNKLLVLNQHANRLHAKLMIPMGSDMKKEDVDQDCDCPHDFSAGLFSSLATQNLFCEASKRLFTSKSLIENMPVSQVQEIQLISEVSGSSNTNVVETEEKRRSELQKKLANKGDKSKRRELKRHGILRK
ncbi:hypothetical protein MN116_005226 [Schistosoma mekongi]|uniref:Uncharacterized protein n=1 Tax=Schistosoma mekongi TaxID=38744 RepID=A0AAE2D5C9_SCHME|nr:hypothetical protein MN116_005226 [Schistosoma mekongi]